MLKKVETAEEVNLNLKPFKIFIPKKQQLHHPLRLDNVEHHSSRLFSLHFCLNLRVEYEL